jgi:Arc/MetJ family transcription regulator
MIASASWAGWARFYRGTRPSRVYCTAGSIRGMTPPEVEVDAELAARAAEVAATRGESLEEVIARALQRYVISSLDE